MNREQVRSAINVLLQLFYADKQNQTLALQTMEYYISELRLLEDEAAVAEEIQQQKAFALLRPMKLLDYIAAKEVEKKLR